MGTVTKINYLDKINGFNKCFVNGLGVAIFRRSGKLPVEVSFQIMCRLSTSIFFFFFFRFCEKKLDLIKEVCCLSALIFFITARNGEYHILRDFINYI